MRSKTVHYKKNKHSQNKGIFLKHALTSDMESVLRINFHSHKEHINIKISEIWDQWAACLM